MTALFLQVRQIWRESLVVVYRLNPNVWTSPCLWFLWTLLGTGFIAYRVVVQVFCNWSSLMNVVYPHAEVVGCWLIWSLFNFTILYLWYIHSDNLRNESRGFHLFPVWPTVQKQSPSSVLVFSRASYWGKYDLNWSSKVGVLFPQNIANCLLFCTLVLKSKGFSKKVSSVDFLTCGFLPFDGHHNNNSYYFVVVLLKPQRLPTTKLERMKVLKGEWDYCFILEIPFLNLI